MNRKQNQERMRRRGATVVETAVVAPLVLAATFGIIMVGYAFMVRQTVTLAAREGARAGVLPGASATDVYTRVSDTLENLGLSGAQTQVDMGTDDNPEVTVTVSMPFSRSLASAGFFSGSFDIESTAVMRKEGVINGGTQDTVQNEGGGAQ